VRRLRYAALGAALAYFFDPNNGRARRKAAIKRIAELRNGKQGELVDELVDQARTPEPVAEPASAPAHE
jgi:hypothetical protein